MTLLERCLAMLTDVRDMGSVVTQDADWRTDLRELHEDLRAAVTKEQDRREKARVRRRCGV